MVWFWLAGDEKLSRKFSELGISLSKCQKPHKFVRSTFNVFTNEKSTPQSVQKTTETQSSKKGF
jgi:hypothetical protein